MREIKFRVFDEEHNNMFYDLGIIGDELLISLDGSGYDSVGKYKNFNLMQYTGLIDVNGREIYEGDIVRQYPRSGYEHIVTNGDIGIVESSHGAYIIRNSHSGRTHFLFYSEQEVIGNIYQHKHLLKENEK